MIDAYLQFARGDGDEKSQRVDLREFFTGVIESNRRGGVRIKLNFEGDISLMLKPVAFERCIGNIISNANEYAESIEVSVSRRRVSDGNVVRIVVDDDGPGVSEELYEEVFKPFYRGDSSRKFSGSNGGGSGLGLAVAREVVHAHGGEIRLGKSHMGGVSVVITLPL